MTDQQSPAPPPQQPPAWGPHGQGGPPAAPAQPPPTAPRPPGAPGATPAPSWGPQGQRGPAAPGGGPPPPTVPEEHHEVHGAHTYGHDGEVRIIKQVPIDQRLADDYTPYLKVGGLVVLVLALIVGGVFGALKIFGGDDEEVATPTETTSTTEPPVVDGPWTRQTPRPGSLSMEMPPTARQQSKVETPSGEASTTLLFADRGEFAIAAGELMFPDTVEMDIKTAADIAMAQISGTVGGLESDLSGYLEAADVEGTGTWEGKPVVVRARLQKIPTGAAIFLGVAPDDQVEAMREEFDRMFASFSVNE